MNDAAEPLTVGVAPSIESTNPYLPLLYEHLRLEGVQGSTADLRPWGLRSTIESVQVLHLHWPEYILGRTAGDAYSRARSVVGARALLSSIRRLRASGIPTVWTVHNRRPHASNVPDTHRRLYLALAQDVDGLIAHSPGAAESIVRDLRPRQPITVIPHGNYGESYARVGRAAARERLGISEEAVLFLSFGSLSEYKGLEDLASTFRTTSEPHWNLLIAGAASSPRVVESLQRTAADDPRITVWPRFMSDHEVGDLFGAADVAVFNYRDLFSSGAIVLAQTQGVSSLVLNRGLVAELPAFPAAAAYESTTFEAVAKNLLAVPTQARARAATSAADRVPWSTSAKAHAEMFRDIVGRTTALRK